MKWIDLLIIVFSIILVIGIVIGVNKLMTSSAKVGVSIYEDNNAICYLSPVDGGASISCIKK